MMKTYKNIDAYIATFPTDVRAQLKELRAVIQKAAPQAEEGISYGMPVFKLHGVVVYFAAYKTHIGFYPTSSGILHFKKELAKYETAKGTVRFPLESKLPVGLISKIVKFRVQENLKKLASKKKKTK